MSKKKKQRREFDIGEMLYKRYEFDSKIKLDLTEETARELLKQFERMGKEATP